MAYHKFPKYSDTQKIAMIFLKFEQGGSALFAQAYLSENLCPKWVAKDPLLFHVDSKDLILRMCQSDAKPDLSLHWVHIIS